MNWDNLHIFEVVAQEEFLPKASDLLQIPEEAVLRAVDALEKDLGVPLVLREKNRVRLNKYGRILRSHVAFASNEVSKGIRMIQGMAKTDDRVVYLSSIFTMGSNFLPPLIKSFQKQYPDVQLSYYQKSTENILDDILDGNIEFGFCGEFPRAGSYAMLEAEPVMEEELLLAVPPDHWLASRDSVSFEEIKEESFVGYTDNTGIIYSLEEILTKAGYSTLELEQSYRVAEDNTAAAMVRAGLGIAFLANSPILYTEGIHLLHVTEPALYRKLYMVWNKNGILTPAAKAFKYHVLSSIKRER